MKSFLTTFLLSAGLCSATLPGGAAEEARLVDEPYGGCCHVTRGEQWDAPKLYPLMREAGVSAVRSDWDWRYQENAPGEFNPKYDLLIENIFRGGMDFLPILPGNQPKFGQWAWNHLDDFGRFVRRDTGRARNHFESHFGLLDRDNRPKFAYQALKTLTRLLPGGSTVPRLTTRNDVCLATWTRPDHTRVWALWSAYNRQEGAPVTLRIDGNVTAAMNHLGETRPAPHSGEKVTATGSILYLVGPESVTFSGE